jgi:hypothetical protein
MLPFAAQIGDLQHQDAVSSSLLRSASHGNVTLNASRLRKQLQQILTQGTSNAGLDFHRKHFYLEAHSQIIHDQLWEVSDELKAKATKDECLANQSPCT